MNCSFEKQVQLYALRQLDSAEAFQMMLHLEDCENCSVRLQMSEILAAELRALPGMATPMAAPPELKNRIMTRVKYERDILQSAQTSTKTTQSYGWLTPFRFVGAVATTCVILLGVLLAFNTLGSSGMPVVASASLLSVSGRTTIRLKLSNSKTLKSAVLPTLTKGNVYEVWYVEKNGQMLPAGIELGTSGQNYSASSMSTHPGKYDRIAINEEPTPGTEKPTNPSLAKLTV